MNTVTITYQVFHSFNLCNTCGHTLDCHREKREESPPPPEIEIRESYTIRRLKEI